MPSKSTKPLPTQRRAIEKRQALIDAAIKQFSSTPFELVTAKTLAVEAGVATGTFYQYFENKNEILRNIAHHRVAHLLDRIQVYEVTVVDNTRPSETIEQRFFNTLEFVYEFHKLAPELHQVLEHRRNIDNELDQILLQGEHQLKSRVQQFVSSLQLQNAHIVGANLFAMAEGIVHNLVFGDDQIDHRDALKVGAAMLASFFKAAQAHQH